MEISEQELVINCLKGKKEAQYALYQKYAANMLGVCYRYTKSLDDAEDILQEGFIKVFSKLHQYKNNGALGAWIRRIMVTTALNYLQKHNRYKKEMQLQEKTLHLVSTDNPEINIQAKDLVELIRKLPGNYQVIFNLIAIEGYQYNEVCEMLNLNINTARSIYNRARTLLIELLKNDTIITNKYAEKI